MRMSFGHEMNGVISKSVEGRPVRSKDEFSQHGTGIDDRFGQRLIEKKLVSFHGASLRPPHPLVVPLKRFLEEGENANPSAERESKNYFKKRAKMLCPMKKKTKKQIKGISFPCFLIIVSETLISKNESEFYFLNIH